MKIGITGAGGFIGRHIIAAAHERGHSTVGLELTEDGCAQAAALGAEVHRADIRDRQAMTRAFKGCGALIHTAAMVVEGGDWDTVRSVNVGGTVQVVAAAQAVHASTLVHLSSVMVYGFQFPDGVTEAGPLRGENNPYCQTKIESEAVVRAASDALRTVIFRPGDVYGIGSIPWIVRPLQLAARAPIVVPDTSSMINPLHVVHLADQCVRACEESSPATGAYNLVDGEPITCFNYFSHLAQSANQRTVVIPAPILRHIFRLNSALPRRWRLDISPESIPFLQRPGSYDATRARRELHFTPTRSLTPALNEAIDAFWQTASVSKY